MRDTIAAIATATGGGVGMVRLSGPQALAVAGRVFRPMNPAKSPETMPGYTGAFGRVCHGEQLLDEAVLFVYHAPHSYTGEDVAEFCCHGGEFVLSQVLAAVIAAGARPAEAGEYTRRALMNGRMTLTEAESVIDIIVIRMVGGVISHLGFKHLPVIFGFLYLFVIGCFVIISGLDTTGILHFVRQFLDGCHQVFITFRQTIDYLVHLLGVTAVYLAHP